MGRAETIGRRLRAETIGQFMHAASTSLLYIVLARLLSPDGYGLVFLGLAVVQVTRVASDWGIGKSTARYVSEYRATDPTQVGGILRFGGALAAISVTLVGGVLFIGANQLADLIGTPAVAPFLRVGMIVLISFAGIAFLRVVFQGAEQIEYAGALEGLKGFFRLLFAATFALLGMGAIGAFTGFALGGVLVCTIGLVVFYRETYRTYSDESAPLESGLRRRIVEYALPLTVTRGANQLDKQVDTIIVGAMLTPVAVAYYSLAKQVVTVVDRPAMIVGFVFAPTLSEDNASGDTDSVRQAYERAVSAMATLYIPAGVGLILVADSLIELAFGQEYAGAVVILQVLAVYATLQGVLRITSETLDYFGRAKARAYARGTAAISNVILTVALIPIFGVIGAAYATVITHSLYTALNVWVMYSEVHFDLWTVGRNIGQASVIAVIMGCIVLGLLATTISTWVVIPAIGTGILVWAISVHLTGLLDLRRIATMIY